jgi:cell division protease FtsH
MSSKLGPITLGQKDSQPFLGKEFGHQADYGGQVAAYIDDEVRALLDEAHDEALQILVDNDDVLEALANKLLDVETVDGELLAEVFAPVRHRPSRALSIPEADDPAQVIERLRRQPVGAGTNGHGSGNGNGQHHDTNGRDEAASSTEGSAPKQA